MSNDKIRIKAGKIKLDLTNLENKEDEKQFNILCESFGSMDNGVVLTPIYSNNGQLLSILIDSKEAFEIIEEIENANY